METSPSARTSKGSFCFKASLSSCLALSLQARLWAATSNKEVDKGIDIEIVHHTIAVDIGVAEIAVRKLGRVGGRAGQCEHKWIDVEIIDSLVAVHIRQREDAAYADRRGWVGEHAVDLTAYLP